VIAARYRATPSAIPIEASTATGSDQNSADAEVFAAGTIVWLSRNGFVTGELHYDRAIPNAQLSVSALRILAKKDPNVPRYSIGDQVLRATEPDSSPSQRTADLLMEFLLGTRT
jgi:hypothetical protein